MPQCSFSRTAALLNATPVQNLFIAEYMPKAPDAYVKVYLFGLMQCFNPALAQEDMGLSLGMEPQALAEAFAYWQAQGLVSILGEDPLRVEYKAPATPAPLSGGGARRYGAFNAALQEALRASLGESGKSRVFFPADMQRIYDWIEVFGLEEEAAILLIQHCLAERGPRASMRYMDEKARRWADAGVLSAEDARRRIQFEKELQSGAQAILRRWRKSRQATEDELALYQKWTKEWGLSDEEILGACAALTAAEKPTFAYLDGVLENARLAGGTEEYARRQAALEDLGTNAFKRAGIQRRPTASQRMQLDTWVYAWHMSPELVLLSAEYAARESRPFAAMERMMKRWHEEGIQTIAAARADHGRQEKAPQKPSPSQAPSRALRPPQRTYTAEDLKHIGVKLLDDEDEEEPQ